MYTILIGILIPLDLMHFIKTACWLASQSNFEHHADSDKGPCN